MEWFKDFPVLIIDDELFEDSAEGNALLEIVEGLESLDYDVKGARNIHDGKMLFLSNANIGCVLIDWDLRSANKKESSPVDLIKFIRGRNDKVPIFLLTEKLSVNEIPIDVISRIEGYIWKMEDTPDFIAGRIETALKQYFDFIFPPFFKELIYYTEEYKYAWHTPGHMGGIAFRKTATGRAFFDYFGEEILRSDLSVSVPELGSLMEHSGVVGEAEANAARVFGADKTYFVTNGTSTANKMVWHGTVIDGDVVLVDRNCHKSLMHAIVMTGARPLYFMPTRNAYGIIGPIHIGEFDESTIREKIKNSPLIKDSENTKVKMAVVTNSTYDGVCYNTHIVKEKLKSQLDFLHFDEAWYGYAKFHPLYKDRFGMCGEHHQKDHPTIFATQSTHKVLAALSQASMVHTKDGKIKLDQERFNEAFMMHTSTSPQYSIIASLDVATKMMEGSPGKCMVEDTMEEAVVFRKKMVKLQEDVHKKVKKKEYDWWFSVWQPDEIVKHEAEDLLSDSKYWTAKPKDSWHGFDGLGDDYIMLDPIKVTILTPGIKKDGTMMDWGIPASIVTKFLMSRGIVVEKTGHYSFLVLFTIGITKGKSGTMLTELFEFKKLYDANAPMHEVFPELVKEYPERYENMMIQDFVGQMHSELKKENITQVVQDIYAKAPDQVMRPIDAYRNLVRGNTNHVKLKDLPGKIPAVMLVPYPPGIPVIMPGEKFATNSQNIIDYMKTCEEFDNNYPGFENEIHGVMVVEENGRKLYTVDCLKNSE